MASSGWLSHLKTRHGISLKVLHGKITLVDASSVSTACNELLKVTAGYDPVDIFIIWTKPVYSIQCHPARHWLKDQGRGKNNSRTASQQYCVSVQRVRIV